MRWWVNPPPPSPPSPPRPRSRPPPRRPPLSRLCRNRRNKIEHKVSQILIAHLNRDQDTYEDRNQHTYIAQPSHLHSSILIVFLRFYVSEFQKSLSLTLSTQNYKITQSQYVEYENVLYDKNSMKKFLSLTHTHTHALRHLWPFRLKKKVGKYCNC